MMPVESIIGSAVLAQSHRPDGAAAVVCFVLYTVVVLVLAGFSHRLLAGRKFLSEYYLGSRSLGVVTLTLTFGATSASAGSFAGFPSLIYTHGWVLALWIAGYMVVPICAMGLLGKRLNQVSRIAGAITLPDILRERFGSSALPLAATMFLVFLLSFYLIPQFKLGAIILGELLSGVPLLHTTSAAVAGLLPNWPILNTIDAEYLVCLLLFGVLVIAYTAYGGFRAVVWTDVLQGVVMLLGVVILLGLALWRVGGLASATEELSQLTTPRIGTASFHRTTAASTSVRIAADTWFAVDSPGGAQMRILRTNEPTMIHAEENRSSEVKVVELTSEEEIDRVRSRWPQGIPPPLPENVLPHVEELREYAYGAARPGVYLTAPGPSPTSELGFLPIGMAFSFFIYWTLSGTGQPASLVRLMAFDRSKTLRHSIAALTVYFGVIYFPLVIIFCCARLIVPGLDQTPDRIMPALAFELSGWAGMPWLAGLLIAAPFAAAMSTVDSFMLLISSAVVRDVYQQTLRPAATEQTVRRLSYACMVLVGTVVLLGAVHPPKFLQYLVVFAGGGLSVTFLIPIVLALYWPRVNTPGALSAMFAGLGTYLALYAAGFYVHRSAQPYLLCRLDPLIWGFAASLASGVWVSVATKPLPDDLVHKFFGTWRQR